MIFNFSLQKALLLPFLYSVIPLGRVTKRLCGGLQILIRGFKSLPALLIILFLFCIIIFSTKASANVLLNEVMYNPETSENYNEWIELYNPTNETINVSGWILSDNYAEDIIQGNYDNGNGSTIIPPFSYAIITDHGTEVYENYNISNNTIKLYVDDKSIGNGLGNSGDKIILKNNQNVTIDQIEWIVKYSDIPGEPAQDILEGFTLSRINRTNNSFFDFYEGFPTPGKTNRIIERGKTEIQINSTNFLVRRDETINVPFRVKNIGDFKDNITIKIQNISDGWGLKVEKQLLLLNSNTSENINIIVYPCKRYGCNNGNLTLSALSDKELNESDQIKIFFEILAPDLWIKTIKLYNEEKKETDTIKQGEIVRIKAFLKNLGLENASNVDVSCYFDEIKKECLIGKKYYESVCKYQKYPSFLWDTINIKPGKHKILVTVDENNKIEELNEINNVLYFQVNIQNTTPSFSEKQVSITELYYHTHPNLCNEFVKIFNPTNNSIDISGWYITSTPEKNKNDQKKIIFPNNTFLQQKSLVCITQKAADYYWETGEFADFEYYENSDENISDMYTTCKISFSNNGGNIVLKNFFNHTIDSFPYYENSSSEGFILNKDFEKSGIGWSDFSFNKMNFFGEITTFVSPDNSFEVISSEIRKANCSIYLNVYEFSHPLLCDDLIDALLRNVSVYLFLEGGPVGGISFEEKRVLNRIKDYGGNIRFIDNNPDKNIYERYNFDHAKYLIIDNRTLVVESCNWVKTGIPQSSCFGNREWGIIVRNESVAKCFLNVFLDDFNPNRCDSFSIEDINTILPEKFYNYESYQRYGYKSSFVPFDFKGNFTILPVFSPDNSLKAVLDLVESANTSILVQQLYIYLDWDERVNPLVEKLVEKAKQGVDVKVIINYNPFYDSTNIKCNLTKKYLEENGVKVKFLFTNWSYFTNVHNKGVVVDNKSVLISSINWNKNSFTENREAGIIVENKSIAKYYSSVFFYDWALSEPMKEDFEEIIESSSFDYKNTFYVVVIYTLTLAIVIRDWRKRKWT